ncbi:MAG TPA: hypothetical protein VFQ45_17570 [Longimicrobium sp.]|nr:hypothetical protein [Longimicrobium sp.]
MQARASRAGWIIAAVLMIAGCDGSPSVPDFDPVGSVSFTYTGARSGSYEAQGAMIPQGGTAPQPVTGATAYREGDVLSILAFRATTATVGDGFVLVLGGVTQRSSVQLDPLSCSEQSLSTCRAGVFAPNIDAAALSENPDLATLAANAYVLAIGSVNVTTFNAVRVKGTFSGTAIPLGGTGFPSTQQVANLVTISNGRFDVPLQPQ